MKLTKEIIKEKKYLKAICRLGHMFSNISIFISYSIAIFQDL